MKRSCAEKHPRKEAGRIHGSRIQNLNSDGNRINPSHHRPHAEVLPFKIAGFVLCAIVLALFGIPLHYYLN
jgi:hypothetical protein